MIGNYFRKLSVTWKLTLTIILVATVISAGELALFTFYDFETFLGQKRQRIRVIAEIIGTNVLPALTFSDRGDALEILRSLATVPTVRSAYLFTENGGLLAEYLREGESLSVPLDFDKAGTELLEEDNFILIHRIFSEKHLAGTLYLVSDLEDVYQRKRDNLIRGISAGGAFLIVSIILAYFLQRVFTLPIQQLLATTRAVAESKDYSVRAPMTSNDEFGELMSGFNTMLSEIEQRDRELAAKVAQLQRTNKELDQFVYVASHDLKAPLRGVENLTRLIEKAVKDSLPPDKLEYLTIMQSRVKRMERLLDDLLQYSRVGRIQADIEEVNCTALLRDIVQLLSPPNTFVIIIPNNLPNLHTYKTPLEQVFRNLLNNAIKHHNRKNGTVELAAHESGDFYEFSVCDDGPGIAAKYHEKVFEMFQTLKPRDEVEGSGMGLALVKKIVDDQGGRIWLRSAEGQGTCFYFTWPKVSNSHTAGDTSKV